MKHVAPSLQKPEYIYAGGALRKWDEANLHVASEAVQRGLNVFEGLKGYWQPDGSFAVVALREHYNRMRRSARLMHIPFDISYAAFANAVSKVAGALARRDGNMWFRATLYLTEGHWGVGDKSDLVVAGYQTILGPQEPFKTGIATWRRSSDNALPARIKTSSNYVVARFCKIEGRERGYPEMILLNEQGRVAEFIGSGLLMVRNGAIVTPAITEGAFESITIDILEALAADMDLEFIRRPVERSELLIAEEVGCVSTIAEVIPMLSIDTFELGEPKILTALRDRYLEVCMGLRTHRAVQLETCVAAPAPALAKA